MHSAKMVSSNLLGAITSYKSQPNIYELKYEYFQYPFVFVVIYFYQILLSPLQQSENSEIPYHH